MIKVKKSLSLLIIGFLILSNFAFAESVSSNSGSNERKESEQDFKEEHNVDFKDEHNFEGEVKVSNEINSKEKYMMERFMKGEINEDEMRAMTKEKMGGKFDEMEFQKEMLEFKERTSRKEAFSYENEGYQNRYDVGPSYGGYSKEQMIFGMVFEHISDDIDPRDIKKFCNDPNKIADIVIQKFKEKVGDLQKACTKFEEQEAKCLEYSKKSCSQIGTAMLRDGSTEMEKMMAVAYSCPVNKDAIVESCKIRSKSSMDERMKHISESCEQRFDFQGERLMKECERFKEHQMCDKEKYLNQCMNGNKKEDFERKKAECPYHTATEYPIPKCEEGTVLHEKTNSIGCFISYECISMKTTNPESTITCPTQSTPACKEGETLQKKTDDKGCVYYYCQATATTTTQCPESQVPTCASGTAPQKKVDDKGCINYYCAAPTCPTVQKPTCNTGEILQAYYDNAGCATIYQCIAQQTTCPAVSKPACAEGQSLTIKYDDKRCVTGYECISLTTTTSAIRITGGVVVSNYDELLNRCENAWVEQQKICSNTPSACDKNTFIERCKEQEEKNAADYSTKIEQHCESDTASEIKYAEQRCSKIDAERQRCFEQSTKRCGQMKGVTQNCKETLTEENLREFIVEEAKKKCKFTGFIQNKEDVKKAEKAEIILAVLNTATESDLEKLKLFVNDLKEDLKLQDTTVYKGTIEPNRFGDVKLLPFIVNAKLSSAASSERAKEVKEKIVAGQKAEDAAGKLVSLRDSDIPKEYLYIIEDKASDVLNVSDKLNEIEKKEGQKGLGYKIRLFLGLAKQAEKEEIKQLEESKEKLNNSIGVLTKLSDEVPSDVAKAILKEQVESLKNQQEDIEVLIKTKEKKSKGLLGLFG